MRPWQPRAVWLIVSVGLGYLIAAKVNGTLGFITVVLLVALGGWLSGAGPSGEDQEPRF